MENKSQITVYRELQGLSLEAFGAKLTPPVDKSTVLRWEKGSLPAWRALQIEQLTGIPRAKLIPHLFANPVKIPKRKTKQEEATQ